MTPREILVELDKALDKVSREEASDFIGGLEGLQAKLWAKLLPPSENPHSRDQEPEDRYLTAEEAAQILNVNKKWLYNRASKLPFTKRLSERKLRFSEKGLRQWVRSRRN